MPSFATHPTPPGGHEQARPRISQPLQYTGSLEAYQKSDLTPVIGREYHGLQVADILKSEESERLIKDLAATSMLFCATLWIVMEVIGLTTTVSQRGVVFLHDQDVTPQQMREFGEKLTALAGCVCLLPLHMHAAYGTLY